MKKILIIEDDQIVANIYRNKLVHEGYQAEIAPDGETGLKTLRTYQPELVILDLMLPQMSGVEVIKHVRSEKDFEKLPIVVFSNTYLTNLVQEAWKAGATKCLSKASCSPKDVIDVVRHTIGQGEALHKTIATPSKPNVADDIKFQQDLQRAFIQSLPATLVVLRTGMQNFVKAVDETNRLKHIYELYRRVHALNGNAGLAGMTLISHMAAALEAFLKELYEKPKNINASTSRTVAAAVDFLGFMFERGVEPERQQMPMAKILVVDDEEISRRAIIYALEKAHLQSTNVADPAEAQRLLSENTYDLVFLDVDMPVMTGFELCAKLRGMPMHKKTPVVFVTALSDFDNRTSSMMAGGNDFIAKPFLFIELTVKALIHVLRSKLQPSK